MTRKKRHKINPIQDRSWQVKFDLLSILTISVFIERLNFWQRSHSCLILSQLHGISPDLLSRRLHRGTPPLLPPGFLERLVRTRVSKLSSLFPSFLPELYSLFGAIFLQSQCKYRRIKETRIVPSLLVWTSSMIIRSALLILLRRISILFPIEIKKYYWKECWNTYSFFF